MKAMELRSIGKIHVDVLEACKWFKKIDIPTAGTRLEAIRNYLDELLNPTTPEAAPLGANATEEDAYYALSDGAGFGLIATEMSKLSSQLLPRQALKDILKGPLVASEEEPPTTDDARNKFVELELAAYCSSAGFRLLGFEDLKFAFEGHHYLVECKRPFSEANLDYHIEKGYSQLQRKLNHASDRGIVAVAVEKVFGLDKRFREVESASSASEFAVSIAKQFRRKIVQYDLAWIDTRVVGFLAIIRFLTKTREPESCCANYIPVLIKRASPQIGQVAESQRLDSMMEVLRQRFLAF
jgi:hypothetical protein